MGNIKSQADGKSFKLCVNDFAFKVPFYVKKRFEISRNMEGCQRKSFEFNLLK